MLREKLANAVSVAIQSKIRNPAVPDKILKGLKIMGLGGLGGGALGALTFGLQNMQQNNTASEDSPVSSPTRLETDVSWKPQPLPTESYSETVPEPEPSLTHVQKKPRFSDSVPLDVFRKEIPEIIKNLSTEIAKERGYKLPNFETHVLYSTVAGDKGTGQWVTDTSDNKKSMRVRLPLEEIINILNDPDSAKDSNVSGTLAHELSHGDLNNPFIRENIATYIKNTRKDISDPYPDGDLANLGYRIGRLQREWLRDSTDHGVYSPELNNLDDLRDYPGRSMNELRATYDELAHYYANPKRLLLDSDFRDEAIDRATHYPSQIFGPIMEMAQRAADSRDLEEKRRLKAQVEYYVKRALFPLYGYPTVESK